MAKKQLLFEGSLYDRTVVLSTIAQERVAKLIEAEPAYRKLKRGLRSPGGLEDAALAEFLAMSRWVVADSLIVIVFAALALESCLYTMIFKLCRDDVSMLLNETRFPTLDRWRVLLWRLTGEVLATDSALYKALRRTIKARDTVVHSKPTVLTVKNLAKLNQFDVVNEARHAVDTVREFERYVHGFGINLVYTLLKI